MKKVALVTGGASGIGKAIVLALAKDGFEVAICDINVNAAEEAAEEVQSSGRHCKTYIANVANRTQVRSAVDSTVKEFGRIDVLVNNAGVCIRGMIEDVSIEKWERTMDINVKGVFLCSQAVLPYMKKKGSGKIINACSQAAFSELSGTIAYSTSKWAVRGMTRTMAIELAPFNINVNSYCPGIVNTEMTNRIDEHETSAGGLARGEYLKEAINTVPLRRIINPEEVAALVSYLASAAGDNITGQSMMLNGGCVMS